MKYKNFESNIKNIFQQDTAAVDSDMLLANLGLPLDTEPNRKPIAWWVITSILVLAFVASTAGFFLLNGKSTAAKASTTNTVESMSNMDNGKLIKSVPATAISDDQNGNITNITAANIDSESKTLKSIANANVVNENKANINKANKNNEGITIDNQSSIINKESQSSNNYISDTSISENSEVSTAKISSEIYNTSISNPPVEYISETSTILNNDRQNIEISSIEGLELNPFEIAADNVPFRGPECPTFSERSPVNFSLLAEIGLMEPIKDLSYNGTPTSTFDYRKENENSKEAIQLGLHLKMAMDQSPFYLRGGVAYTRIAEQINEEYNYTELDTMRGIVSVTTSMTGDTVTAIYGDIVTETTFTGRTRRHYYLHLWDVPVAIGYETPVGDFYVGGEVGAQINVSTSGSGLLMRDVNDYVELSEVENSETKVGMSYFGGIHFGKHLTAKSSVQLSARFRYYPSSFSTLDPNINQRYSLAGVHLGYVRRF